MKKLLVLFAILISTTTFAFSAQVNTEAMLQYNQGIDYYKTGQYDDAIGCFRTAIRLDPNYIDAYYNLGSVLEYLQQYEAALAVFKQIIVRKPDDYDSVYKAAWLSVKMGETQKAKTYLTIIPKNSARAADAQDLAKQIDFSLNAAQKPAAPAKKTSVAQSNGIYDNIIAPTGITSDPEGNLYVAEFNNNAILKITPDGRRLVFIKDAKISGPIGIACDDAKNIYIANYNNNTVLKVSNLGEITTLIGNVKKPYCLHIDGNMLFVSCQGSDSVLRYKLAK